MFCRFCGKPIADNARFCGFCGKVQWSESGQDPMQQRPQGQPQPGSMQQRQQGQPQPGPMQQRPQGQPQPGPMQPRPMSGAPVQAASAAANVAAAGGHVVATAGKVAVAGVKTVHHARRVGMVFLILAILIGGFSAYLRFFVSGPEDTVNSFFEAYNDSNFNEMIDCMDPSYQEQFSAMSDLTGDILGDVTGFDIDMGALMDLSPSLLESEGLLSDAKVDNIEITYSGGKLEEFNNEYHIDIIGIEKVLASNATAKVTYTIDGKTSTEDLPMERVGWGDWRISMSDLFQDILNAVGNQ